MESMVDLVQTVMNGRDAQRRNDFAQASELLSSVWDKMNTVLLEMDFLSSAFKSEKRVMVSFASIHLQHLLKTIVDGDETNVDEVAARISRDLYKAVNPPTVTIATKTERLIASRMEQIIESCMKAQQSIFDEDPTGASNTLDSISALAANVMGMVVTPVTEGDEAND